MSHEIYIYQYLKVNLSSEIRRAFDQGESISNFNDMPSFSGNLVWYLKSMACCGALSKLPFLKGKELYDCDREFALCKEDLASLHENIKNIDFRDKELSPHIRSQLALLQELAETHDFENYYITLHGDSGVVYLGEEGNE